MFAEVNTLKANRKDNIVLILIELVKSAFYFTFEIDTYINEFNLKWKIDMNQF